MMDWALRDAAWKLLSLAIAVALWLTFASGPDRVTSVSVPGNT